MVESPITGNGDNPFKNLQINLPPVNPQSISDYTEWAELRSENLFRLLKSNAPKSIVLETLARLEGDLQQIRTLLKLHKSDAVIDVTLDHLGE